MRVLISVGEVSGVRIAKPWVQSLLDRGVECVGMVGTELQQIGVENITKEPLKPATGIVEALPALKSSVRNYRTLKQSLSAVDGVLLVDCPEINLRLASHASALNLNCVYLAPPQAWAWRSHRAKKLRQTSLVGCLFKFEADWYADRGVNACWMGHPLTDSHFPQSSSGSQRAALALMPGSRLTTLKRTLPLFRELVESLRRLGFNHEIVLLAVPEVPDSKYRQYFGEFSGLCSMTHHAEACLSQARVTVAHPGTATLHAVLSGSDLVSVCSPATLTRILGRHVFGFNRLAMPNLLCKRQVFPEFVIGESDINEVVTTIIRRFEAPGDLSIAMRHIVEQTYYPHRLQWIQESVRDFFLESYP